ncbi:glycosyltransferase [Xanthomonas translucens]|uniref:glycosyltransferase n=1 Tax=Xanthomonas campestris pv. translucens TaxID=343 RepID=UPI00200B9E4D|nr:glycosyltransferase [Xanthomonas translucens]UPU49188.1 glycosyltransferase [Xanthomonas translucens pv. undulosa]
MPEQQHAASMRGATVAIFTIGTRGDIQPMLALGRELQQRDHAVRIVTSANFAEQIRAAGLSFFALSGDFQALLENDLSIADRGLQWRAMATLFRERMAFWARDWAAQGQLACTGADLLIGVGSVSLLAAALGEVCAIPVVFAQLQPLTASRQLPPMLLAGRNVPGPLSMAAYQLLCLGVWRVMRPAINQCVRAQLGLRPYRWYGPYFYRDSAQVRVLYGFSTQVLPRPSDWPESAQVCGYWMLQEPQWQPPAALQAFLDAGPAPVYIGFGSMVSADPQAFAATLVEAVRRSGRRAVLASGWGALDAAHAHADAQIFHLRQAPHAWLFPRMAAIVHHGGAGTTGAAAAAGVPSVVVPFYGDQPFWAHCLALQGVAPPALACAGLQAQTLAAALDQAAQPAMVQAAAHLGARIRAEDGVGTALAWLERWGVLPRLGRGEPDRALPPQALGAGRR